MSSFAKKILSAVLCVSLTLGLSPAAAFGAEGSYTTDDLDKMVQAGGLAPLQYHNDGGTSEITSATASTEVIALYGTASVIVLSPTFERIAGILDELKKETLEVGVSGIDGKYNYEWTVEQRVAGSTDNFQAGHMVGGATESPFGISGTGNAGSNVQLALATQIGTGSPYDLASGMEYRYTLKVTDPASGDSATTSITVVVGNYITELYAPQGATDNNFDARLTGTFLPGTVLECKTPIDDQRVLDAFTNEANGFWIDETWQLVAEGADGCIKSISDITFPITKEQAALIEAGKAKIVAFEDSNSPNVYSGNNIKVQHVTDEKGNEHWYVTIDKNGNTSLGSYALMFESSAKTTVVATVAGTGGQISPAGKTEWALTDAWGNVQAPRYVFVPSLGYKVDTVTVSDSAGRVVYSYPASQLTSPNVLELDMLKAGADYELVATFTQVKGNPTKDAVSISAWACDESGAKLSNVSLNADGTLRDGSAVSDGPGQNVSLKGLMHGMPVAVSFSSSAYEPVRVEMSVDGGTSWVPSYPLVGNTCTIDELVQNMQLRFVCRPDAGGSNLPSYAIAGRIVDGSGNTLAATGSQGTAVDSSGNSIKIGTANVAYGNFATAYIAGGANYTVDSVYALVGDGSVRVDLSADLSGSDELGWSVKTRVLDSMVICVSFKPYTAYYISSGRGGSVLIDGAKPSGAVKVAQGAASRQLSATANEGWVIDASKCSGVNINASSDPIKSIKADLAYNGAANRTIKIAFKKQTNTNDDEYVDIEVTVTVEVRVAARSQDDGAAGIPVAFSSDPNIKDAEQGSKAGSGGSSVGASDSASQDEQRGGTVTPSKARIKKGSPYTFSIYPYDGYDLDVVEVVNDKGSVIKTYSKDSLPLITNAESGAGDVLYGYSLPLSAVEGSIGLTVRFAEDPSAKWGPLDTAVISASEGGFVSPSGEVKVPAGSSINMDLSVIPDDGYKLSHLWVTNDGKTYDVANGKTEGDFEDITIKKATKVFAEFDRITIPIYVDDKVPGGSLSPSGTIDVIPDQPKTIYFWADDGNELKRIIVKYDGDDQEYAWDVAPGTYSWDFDDLEEGMTISAEFGPGVTPVVDKCTIGVASAAHGKLTPASVTIEKGKQAEFAYFADTGYMLSGLDVTYADGTPVDASKISYGAGIITIDNVDRNMTITPVFSQIRFYIVRLDMQTEHGSLSASDSIEGTLVVLEGTKVSINVVPDEGYEVDGEPVYIEDEEEASPFDLFSTSKGSKLSYANGVATLEPYASGTLTATFKQINSPDPDDPIGPGTDDPSSHDFCITASAGEHGSIEPDGEIGVDRGQDMVFTFTPDEGYMVASVTVDGEKYTGRRTQWVFTDVQQDHSIRVEFEPKHVLQDSPLNRVVRTLMAVTGDNTGAVVLGLAAIACASAGFVFYSARRRKREE